MKSSRPLDVRLFRVIGVATLLMLSLPMLIPVLSALDSGEFFTFPPTDVSSRWFREFLANRSWRSSTFLTFSIAIMTAAVSSVVGGLAGIAFRACACSRAPDFLPATGWSADRSRDHSRGVLLRRGARIWSCWQSLRIRRSKRTPLCSPGCLVGFGRSPPYGFANRARIFVLRRGTIAYIGLCHRSNGGSVPRWRAVPWHSSWCWTKSRCRYFWSRQTGLRSRSRCFWRPFRGLHPS